MSDYIDSDLEKDQQELDLNEQDTPGEIYGPEIQETATEERNDNGTR